MQNKWCLPKVNCQQLPDLEMSCSGLIKHAINSLPCNLITFCHMMAILTLSHLQISAAVGLMHVVHAASKLNLFVLGRQAVAKHQVSVDQH